MSVFTHAGRYATAPPDSSSDSSGASTPVDDDQAHGSRRQSDITAAEMLQMAVGRSVNFSLKARRTAISKPAKSGPLIDVSKLPKASTASDKDDETTTDEPKTEVTDLRSGTDANNVEQETETLLGTGHVVGIDEDDEESEEEVGNAGSKKWTRRRKKLLKLFNIILPHLVLTSVTMLYLIAGARLFQYFESDDSVAREADKIRRLTHKYDQIVDETWRMRLIGGVSEADWLAHMRISLLALSDLHEENWSHELNHAYPNVTSAWTFPTAILNALTLVAACGYTNMGARSPDGQMFVVAYTMLGIPLMFVTAANIGKFLTEAIESLSTWLHTLLKLCSERCKPLQRFKLFKVDPQERKSGSTTTAGMLLLGKSYSSYKDTLWFPVFVYLTGISAYCTMGTLMFRYFCTQWSFMKAFHFGFNFIVTIELGEITVTNYTFLALVVAFCLVGLAVVTMCIDLASTQLEAYFMKLHYAGRWPDMGFLDRELMDMVRFLHWMRESTGEEVTWKDVRILMETIRLGAYNPRKAQLWAWIDHDRLITESRSRQRMAEKEHEEFEDAQEQYIQAIEKYEQHQLAQAVAEMAQQRAAGPARPQMPPGFAAPTHHHHSSRRKSRAGRSRAGSYAPDPRRQSAAHY